MVPYCLQYRLFKRGQTANVVTCGKTVTISFRPMQSCYNFELTVCRVISHAFVVCGFVHIFYFKSFMNTIILSNIIDPYHAWLVVGSGLDPNCLPSFGPRILSPRPSLGLSADDKSILYREIVKCPCDSFNDIDIFVTRCQNQSSYKL